MFLWVYNNHNKLPCFGMLEFLDLKFWGSLQAILEKAIILVMGPGQKFLTQVGLGRVSHLWFGVEFGKFCLKMLNFSIFFPSDQKKSLWAGSESTRVEGGSASYLLRVKSKLGYSQVRSGPISNMISTSLHSIRGKLENKCASNFSMHIICVYPSINSNSSLSLDYRELKFCIYTLHINAKKVTYLIFEILSRS